MPLLADQRGQRAGIDAGEPDDAARLQPVVEMSGRAVIRRRGDGAVQDDAAGAGPRRHVDALDVFFVGADIADMREGEGDDLPGIGRVGEDFLIAGHGGVEADLADRMAGRRRGRSLPARFRRPAPRARSPWARPKRRSGGGFGLGHGLLVAYYSVRSKGPPDAAPKRAQVPKWSGSRSR